MNINETSQTAGDRVRRIKFVSRIFRVLLGLYVAGMVAFYQGLLTGLLGVLPGVTKLSLSPHQTYTAPFDIPARVIVVAVGRFSLIGFGLFLLNRLFGQFERGNFFTNENVRCIKYLGLIVAGDWLLKTILDLMAGRIGLELNELLFGLFIVLIAWIMDEGRKIHEEQQLTV
jgi:hypothetical protein